MSSILMAARLTATHARGLSGRMIARQFSGPIIGGTRGWRNDTPKGSRTEVFVYSRDSDITWPDEKLGVLGTTDPKFRLPGNTGINLTGYFPETENPKSVVVNSTLDIITAPTTKESQVHALYNANDFIKYSEGSEDDIFADLLDDFPPLIDMENVDIAIHDAPLLLRKDMQSLFPGKNIESGTFTALTYSQKTENDMSKWSDQVDEEREMKMEKFVQVAKEICGRLKEEGFWADFIDPCSGTPYYGNHTNSTMFETDEKFRSLGFQIEDLGCCKVILHPVYGKNVFVGCILTNASKTSIVFEEIFEDMLYWGEDDSSV